MAIPTANIYLNLIFFIIINCGLLWTVVSSLLDSSCRHPHDIGNKNNVCKKKKKKLALFKFEQGPRTKQYIKTDLFKALLA